MHLFAALAIAVAVEMASISGLSGTHRRCTCGARRCTIGKIDVTIHRALDRGRRTTRATMAVPPAILPVVMTSVSCQTAAMCIRGTGRHCGAQHSKSHKIAHAQFPIRPREYAPKVYICRTRLTAFVAAPVFLPFCSPSTCNHIARHIAGLGRDTEGRRPVAARTAVRAACHGRAANKYMAFTRLSGRLSDQPHQRVSRIDRIGIGAWMADTARSVQLPCRNAGQADMWTFGAPDRPVAVPYADRRALK